MKKSNFGKRVVAFLLVFVMMVSLLPLSVFAVNKFDVVTDRDITYTGIDNSSLNQNGTINWPVKIYDYLADGMLFEFAQADGSVMYSSNKGTTDDYSGQYVLGRPMPTVNIGHDFTTDYVYTGQSVNTGYEMEDDRYVKTKMAAVDYQSPQYMRITPTGKYPSNFSTNMNCCITNFTDDNGGNKAKDSVRYVTMVYRAGGIANSGAVPGFALNIIGSSGSWLRFPANDANLYDVYDNTMTNTSEWKVFVADLATLHPTNWSSLGSNVATIYLRLVMDSMSDYFDISHIGYFSTEDAAKQFGEQCLAFINEPGEYISGTYWNGAGNDGFGMLYSCNGASWNSGGGKPLTSTTGGQYAGYYTQAIGYAPEKYLSSSSTYLKYNSNRYNGKDSDGRYNGSGSLIGDSDMIYLMSPKTYWKSTAYQNVHPGATSFDLSELKFDGYSLLTKSTKGVFTAGLLEGQLSADKTPVYRQEAVEYIADMLSKTLVIPRKASNGNNNYNFVAGVKSRQEKQFGVTAGVNNDLAQGLRNCLGIYFNGNTTAAAPKMGTYEETLAKADKLKGPFMSLYKNINTCMDAAYYLLNNLFVPNSYNQPQTDYKYLTLSSAKLSDGTDAFVFDGGFSNGASLDDVANGTITQDQYKELSDSAVEYSSSKNTISLNKVDEKDYFYYQANEGTYTTMYPFLPVTGATGDYAGGTDSYYFAEDGKRSYTDEFGTYKNRNYNYTLASNGEFVYHEEDGLFFEFEGDDDVYLFLNGQLVLDLGGGHSVSSSSLNVNDYVNWARKVLSNPSGYSEAEIARAEALNLENGEIVSFDFYYMERHGYGANMRIATNMRITDPDRRVEKTAYQSGKQVEYGGIVDADKPIEYNFKLSNVGNTKLYNLTFDDADIGVSLTPEKGLFVKFDDTPSIDDDINGFLVTDVNGQKLEAKDLTAIVTGYQQVGAGNGDYIQNGHEYTKVEAGKGTHVYYDALTITFSDNEALKRFLTTLDSEKTDNETVDDELTQQGSGLWVDSSVTFKGIYYTMTDVQESAGMFDNIVKVTATTRVDTSDALCETLRSEANHRVYVTAIPSYYQWAGHNLFISKEKLLQDASAEAGNQSSMLHDYIEFFNTVNGNKDAFITKFCDRAGNLVNDSYYPYAGIKQAKDGLWGYMTSYPEPGIYEFFLLCYLNGLGDRAGDISKMNLGEYAVVRVLIIVTDVEDAEYVLDYGLSTENLDVGGELFKNDELFGQLSGTQAKVVGFTSQQPSYLDPTTNSPYNRINFSAQDISQNNKFVTDDGYYTANISIPEGGKLISYNEYADLYTLTEAGTVTIHADTPYSWGDMYLYYWYDDGRHNAEFPGQQMTMTSHGNYELAIPANAPHIIITHKNANGEGNDVQTFDLHLNEGHEAWVKITGETALDSAAGGQEKYLATVNYNVSDATIHASVPEGWGDVYYYCWDAFKNDLEVWPGTKVETIDEDGFYTFTIPGDITNIIINNGDNGKQTTDQVIYAGAESWIVVNDTVTGTDQERGVDYYGATVSRCHPDETVTMHASVPEDWQGAAIYYWNSNGSATQVNWPGLAMTKGSDGVYHIEGIPADVTNVIINDGQQAKAKQTHNLTITPGVETWFDVQVKSGDGTTNVRATVPTSWSNANVYFFNDAGTAIGGAWPGTAATKVSDGIYTIDAPNGATKYIVNNGSGEQTQDLLLILGTTNKVEFYGNKNARPQEETKLHIEATSGWENVYVHYWYKDNNGQDHSTSWPGVAATKNNDGTYSITIPAGYNKFLINNGSGEQTDDITEFYMGIENHVTIYNDKNDAGHNTYRVGMPYQTDIVYGENAEKEGLFFTPTNFMDSLYSIWMAVVVHENNVNSTGKPTALGNAINIAKEVQMYKKITVLPANVVYYEDDFAGIRYNTDTTNIFFHYGNGSGSLTQSVDQKQEYGQDETYQGSENDEITGGSLTKLEVKDAQEFASFDFKGTGFEIIGHTHAEESASMRVVVKDENGNVVKEKTVITEFDQGADGGSESVEHISLIRITGLTYGKYTVSINGIPVYDFSQWDGDRTHMPPTKKACLCLDGVRIYQPLDNSDCEYENLALNKKTDVKPYHGSTYTASLTDGNADTILSEANWFAFRNTGDSETGNIDPNNNRAVFTVNLGCEAEVSKIQMHTFKGTNSIGAGDFGYINVYASTDGVKYNYLQTINPDTTKTAPYWATLDLSSAPVTAKYIKFALGADAGATVLINEIEIYGTEVTTAGRNDAYLDSENGASFTEIRNLIAERRAFVVKYDDTDGLSVSGGTNTWIENRNNVDPSNRSKKWTNNTVNSVEDYLLAGPNNEVYMIESTDEEKSALVFYVTEEQLANAPSMQVAIRGIDYGAFTGSENTGLINAEVQYGKVKNGEFGWETLVTRDSTSEQYYTIPYTECPYDEENNRYQVALRIADTDITGMAAYTTIKLNGLTLNTLNTAEVPDIPEITYDDELNNTIVDNKGNVVPSNEYVNFALLLEQMKATTFASTSAVSGVDTSALGALYDSFTADSSQNLVLTEGSKIFIVTASEDAKPSAETIETAQLVQTQFMADKRPTANAMEIVWGLEKYAQAGDILIYANASGYDSEEFKIVVTDRAKVYASDDRGLLYALNTLQKHFRKANSNAIKGFTIQDAPDTLERTLHLDVARKYQTVESIKNYIAEISWMGYNAIELHFSEDGGFRMDFWGDTALRDVPGMTGNDFSWVCGSNPAPWVFTQFQDTADKGKYLTTEDVIEVCQTAKQYNIEVIPSFDTPAHVGYMTELYYKTVQANNNSPIRNFTYNGTNYTLPTQINYREYTGTSDTRYDFSVLDLSNTAVKNFAYAMYTDIAAFFKYYAGSTDFNIGADEVALKSTDVWTYTDFINYVNQVNAVLKSQGYRARMYNDFLYNTTYSSATTGIDTDVDVVYWLPAASTRTNLRTASFYANQGRNVYSGVNFWTYYVLRIAPTSTATHMDARDPDNRQWEFYRNQEDTLYNEWNASQLGAYTDTNMGASYNYSGDKLAGAYFMIWNDFAGLNTEVEVWNGCYDTYGKYSNSKYSGYGYYYSMIERMWSSGIKQWNADINSTLTFANFETLRDSMGFFPGYVATDSSQAYANGMVLAQPTAVSDTAYRTIHTVTFKDYNGKVLSTQQVRDLTAATAPDAPTRVADVWYTYTFSGWDTDFSNITKDTVVTATYSQVATTAGTIGYLGVTVSGGTNFKMSINDGVATPKGIEYVNPSMELGVKVTLTAETTNSNKFMGWIDAKTGNIVTTSLTYTFNTSGNDLFVALFDRDVEGMNTVTFRNDKTSQVLDMQYYSSTDTIDFPDATSYPGYEFTGWSMTQGEIQAKLAEGKDVVVTPIWENADVYFSVTVNGGSVTDSPDVVDGKYIGYKGTTVTANKASAGKMFAYWSDEDGNILSYNREYKFYPFKDTVLTANYITTTTLGVGITGTMPEPEEPEEDTTTPETFTIYFKNNWLWSDVRVHYWGGAETTWPGNAMNFLEKDGEYDVYTVEIPSNVTGFLVSGIKNDGSGNRDKTPDITEIVDGRQYSMTWNNGNAVETDDSRVEDGTEAEYNTLYFCVSNEWKSDNAWFAAYVWDSANSGDNAWYELTNVSGNIYSIQVPAKYSHIIFTRMNPASKDLGWNNTWNQTVDLTTTVPNENNMYVLDSDWKSTATDSCMNTLFFVNDSEWETITVTYTDAYGTHATEAVKVDTDANGNDIYSMLVPANAQKVTFSNGTNAYDYTAEGEIAHRAIFGLISVANEVKYDVATSVGIDTKSQADSNTVVFSWEVPEETGYTFINAGLLLVKEENYRESSFVAGTIDSNVIQFVPAKKYQTSTGTHSITMPYVSKNDTWVVCSFVQYRGTDGILRTKYSKQVTGKK